MQNAAAPMPALDFSSLGAGDLAQLVLQRSEVLAGAARPGAAIRAWNAGDNAPLAALVKAEGPALAQRAAEVIWAEYQTLAPLLRAFAPRRVADIGCGYAFFDLFLAREFGAECLLIDLEQNARRHFGFAEEGAAYSDLGVAAALLQKNGVPGEKITLCNPGRESPPSHPPFDLIVSFLSCGFHYPAATYLDFFQKALAPGGALILDLRARTAAAQLKDLTPLGVIEDLPSPAKARRILLRKAIS